MIRFLSLLLGLFIMLSNSTTGFTQTTDALKEIKGDVDALKEGQKAIQKEIQEIKKALQPKPAPAEFKEAFINIKGDPFKGDKNARLALIEISDYQ